MPELNGWLLVPALVGSIGLYGLLDTSPAVRRRGATLMMLAMVLAFLALAHESAGGVWEGRLAAWMALLALVPLWLRARIGKKQRSRNGEPSDES